MRTGAHNHGGGSRRNGSRRGDGTLTRNQDFEFCDSSDNRMLFLRRPVLFSLVGEGPRRCVGGVCMDMVSGMANGGFGRDCTVVQRDDFF